MAPKGKKKKKSSKAKKEPGDEEEKKPEEEAPEYQDPKLAFPEVEIEIKLATPPIDELSKQKLMSKLTFDIALNYKLRTSTRLATILQYIIDSHDGAIKAQDITMCLDHYHN